MAVPTQITNIISRIEEAAYVVHKMWDKWLPSLSLRKRVKIVKMLLVQWMQLRVQCIERSRLQNYSEGARQEKATPDVSYTPDKTLVFIEEF